MAAKRQFLVLALICELVFLALFARYATYSPLANIRKLDSFRYGESVDYVDRLSQKFGVDFPRFESQVFKANVLSAEALAIKYSMFQDVQVMTFVGFGFLMTFLKRYGYTALGVNMVLSAVVVQWAIVLRGVVNMRFSERKQDEFFIGIEDLLNGDLSAMTVLVSMGVMLGKLSPVQFLIMGLIEVPFALANEKIVLDVLQVADFGRSTVVHLFGAYFGLALAPIMCAPRDCTKLRLESDYQSDLFAMLGTLFLWVFWPSCNAALAGPPDISQRAIINTYLSMTTSCVFAFILSSALEPQGKYKMRHIQNATLAGGVAIGSACGLLIGPFFSALVGALAATVSVIGYRFLTPALNKLGIHDSRGVHNVHGLPAVLSTLVAAFASVAALQDPLAYGRAEHRDLDTDPMHHLLGDSAASRGKNPYTQIWWQLLSLLSTLAVAFVGAIVTGCLLRCKCWEVVDPNTPFTDETFFQIAHESATAEAVEIEGEIEEERVPLTAVVTEPKENGDVVLENSAAVVGVSGSRSMDETRNLFEEERYMSNITL